MPLRPRTAALLAAAIILIGTTSLPAQPPAVRTDFYGDPLPNGAVARCGSLRKLADTYEIGCPVFSPDGKSLITGAGDADRIIRVWDPLTGRQLARWVGHKSGVERIVCARDSTWAASASGDGTVRIWDVASGKTLRTLEPNDGLVYGLALSPDGKTLASAGRNAAVHLWDPLTGKKVKQFGETSGLITHLQFSPDGATLATSTWRDAAVRLWNVTEGKERYRVAVPAGECVSFAYTPDGQAVILGGYDGAIHVCDPRTGRLVRPLAAPLEAAEGDRKSILAVACSPDGRTVAAAYDDRFVRLWERVSGQERALFAGHAASLAFSPDGSLLASGDYDRTVVVWDVAGRYTLARPGADEFGALWGSLGGDGRASFRAGQRLALAGDAAVSFLKRKLKPVSTLEAKAIAALVAELDGPKFTGREKAAAALLALGDVAEPALCAALDGNPSAELRRRAPGLLEQIDVAKSPVLLSQLRAVEVLERVGTPAARALLRDLATGAETARLTRDAKAALMRLPR